MSDTVSATSSATSAASAYTSSATTPQLPQQTINQDDFLKLLVAQLSAQDPMNPVSDTDFAAQMAQFSTLQQTQTMQKDMSGMQAASLLGKNVEVQNAKGQIDIGAVSAITLQSGTPSVIVNGQSYDLSQILAVSQPVAVPNPTTTSN